MSIPIYMMPGMAASPDIFEFLSFNKQKYSLHYLKWKAPHGDEGLKEYASRMLEDVTHENPVLLGVSFGGLIVQEMAKQISFKKLIIVSSIKTRAELPPKMRLSGSLGIYKIAPVRLIKTMGYWPKFAPTAKLKHRFELYQKYLSVNDPVYLKWALKQMLQWDQQQPPEGIVHIHGDIDPVFPYKYIDQCITVKGGTHTMILTKFRWFNKHLPDIIGN